VLDEFRTSYQRILQTCEASPEDELTTVGRFFWSRNLSLMSYISTMTWEHYHWAKVHIRSWSQRGTRGGQNKESLLKNIQIERRWLEKNLASLSKQEMILAGLRGEVPQIPDPGMTWKDMHKLNQIIYEKNKDRSLDSILDDFDNSYQEVPETVLAI
jgi:hypothetical protein